MKIQKKEGAMINFEMTEDEARTVQAVIERYLYHLQTEIIHTDNRDFRNALKEREAFLKEIIDRFQTTILATSQGS
jgi:hypothetical protein